MSDEQFLSVGPEEPAPPLPDGLGGSSPVTVMWRPGCPFCALLLRGLDRTGLVHDRVDIWEHPEAAAWVRTVAAGNETVPTVRIGAIGTDEPEALALVNPSVTAVLEAVARIAPHGLPPADAPGGLRRGLLARLRRRRSS
jgi:glutaredoxin